MSQESLPVDQAVLRAQQAFWMALKTKDRERFNAVLADDFVAISPQEAPQPKVEFIETLTGFMGEIIDIEGRQIAVHDFGEVAVLTGVQMARVQLPNGMQVLDMLALTNVFRQHGDDWRMVLARPVQMRMDA